MCAICISYTLAQTKVECSLHSKSSMKLGYAIQSAPYTPIIITNQDIYNVFIIQNNNQVMYLKLTPMIVPRTSFTKITRRRGNRPKEKEAGAEEGDVGVGEAGGGVGRVEAGVGIGGAEGGGGVRGGDGGVGSAVV